jgi:coenzyme F420-reducing hydrogenase alpha subunit
MAKDHREVVQRGLQLKKAGNEIVALLGGRAIHPVNVRVGGFYKLPTQSELGELAERLKWARDAALETVRWVAGFPFPDFEQDYEFVALSHPDEYPFNEGRIMSNRGLDIAVREYDEHFAEEHVAHSNALHSTIKGRGPYFCGPMARYSLHFDKLSAVAREAAREAGLGATCMNPFKSIIVRAVEVLYACDEALRIIAEYEPPDTPAIAVEPRVATGYGATEAPRGLLYHRYRVDADGTILDAKIVPPTSQNQKTIENDLWRFIPPRLELTQEQLTWQCEQAVRNYDPCISCATHFLKLRIDHADEHDA